MCYNTDMKTNIPTAAFIIIGNEILDGSTIDSNMPVLINRLNEKGIALKTVHIVSDDDNAIIEAVNQSRKKYDYVFTSGGIGPTHDDITTQAIANAFEVELPLHDEALRRITTFHPDPNDSIKKMAYIPAGATLIDNTINQAPGFQLENVYVMAGVPGIFKVMVDFIFSNIDGGQTMRSRHIYVHAKESRFAKELAEIEKYYPNIQIGSYPNQADDFIKVLFKSYDKNELEECFNLFVEWTESEYINTTPI